MAKKDFIENIHYYLEDGKVIMTEKYLIEKGPCCGNNCRNCPYEPRAIKGNTKLKENNNG